MWRKLATHALTLVIPALMATAAATAQAPAPAAGAAAHPAVSRPVPAPAVPLVIFLGDSLTAGLGLEENQAYPALLDRDLHRAGVPARVINAGVSGDTTAGGLARLGWLLGQHPALIVVGLGANDGLRGLPLTEVEANLRQIIQRSRAAGARVLLLGMRLPPNYGPYAEQFTALYPKLAKELNVPLVPFLLDKVGGIRSLNQADGIHPTAEGQEIVARNVLPYLEKALGK
jgi:acyl-CoA thioesterase-1